MAITLRATGDWSAVGTTSPLTVTIPAGATTGDMMVLVGVWKDHTITASTAWTELTEFTDGAVATAANVGSVTVGVWYKEHDGSEANPAITFSAAPVVRTASITVFQKAGGDPAWSTPTFVSKAMTTWTTSSQTENASATITVPTGGVVIGIAGIRDDTVTFTRPTTGVNGSGVTWNGNYVESPATHASSTTGNDIAADMGHRLVTTGGAGITLTQTATLSAAETGSLVWVVLGASAAATNAPAETATGTGAASNAVAKVAPNAGLGAGTGLARDITTAIRVNTGAATGTGAASDVSSLGLTIGIKVNAGLASGTGLANDATASVSADTNVDAGHASGSGLANDATTLLASNASPAVATGTGEASNPSTAIVVNAIAATGTGIANDATASTSVETNADAETATGTGEAYDGTVTTAVSAAAVTATGTGTVQTPLVSVALNAGSAAGIGAAVDATVTTASQTNVAAGVAGATGTAHDATVTATGAQNAQAGVATGSGTAYNAVADTGAVVVPPVKIGKPRRIRVPPDVRVNAGVARAYGSALGAPVRILTNAGAAQGSGPAHDASVIWNDDDTALLVLLGELDLAA